MWKEQEWWKKMERWKEKEKGGSVVCFSMVNPDTAAFSTHMDWIIDYVGCSSTL